MRIAGRRFRRERLVAQEPRHDEPVLPVAPEEGLSAFGGIALAAEFDQRPGEPGVPRGVRISLVEERLDLDVPPERQEPGDQDIADSLVVVGIEPEHLEEVVDGLIAPARRPQRVREPFAGAHVRPGLEDAPEVADRLAETLRTQRPFAGGDALLIMLERLPGPAGMLREDDVGVRTIRADLHARRAIRTRSAGSGRPNAS